jgi:hypothetical protein
MHRLHAVYNGDILLKMLFKTSDMETGLHNKSPPKEEG